MADRNRWSLHCQPGCLHGNVNWVSPADRTGDLTAPAASPQPRLPPRAPPHLLRAIWGSYIFPSAIPEHFVYISKPQHPVSPSAVEHFFLAPPRKWRSWDCCRRGALSPVMLFAGQVYKVEIACLFFLGGGVGGGVGGGARLSAICCKGAAMTECCRKSFVPGGVQKRWHLSYIFFLLLGAIVMILTLCIIRCVLSQRGGSHQCSKCTERVKNATEWFFQLACFHIFRPRYLPERRLDFEHFPV